MPDVFGRNDELRLIKPYCQRLNCRNSVSVKRMRCGSREVCVSRYRPQLRCSAHSVGRNWKVPVRASIIESAKSKQTMSKTGANHFSPHLVVGNFRNYSPDACVNSSFVIPEVATFHCAKSSDVLSSIPAGRTSGNVFIILLASSDSSTPVVFFARIRRAA